MHDCTHIVHVLHWYVTEGNASAHHRKCHEQRWQPPPTAILGFCKANNFTSGVFRAFLPIYFGSSWELQLNQDKLFWKLPSPFSLIDLNWAAFWIEIRVYSSRHATYVDCCWYSFTQLIPQSKPTLKWYIFLSFTITVTIPLAPPSWEEFDICENFLIYTFSSPLDISATVTT